MTIALGNIRLRGCCKPWCKAWKIIPDRAWLICSKGNVVLKMLLEWKLGKDAECKLVPKKQEDNYPHKWQRGDCYDIAILWQYPTTKQVEAPLVPQLVACFKALLAPPCWPWNAYKRGIIIWEQWESERQRECVKRIERKGEELQWQQPCCHCSCCNRSELGVE